MYARLLADLQQAKDEVLADPNCELSFKTRKELLLDLGPLLKDEKGRQGVIGPGLIRRARLCIVCVRRVLPQWEAVFPSRDPHIMLELSEAYLDGRADRRTLDKRAYPFRGGLEASDVYETTVPLYVGMASVCAAFATAWDEVLEPDEGLPLEELYDPEDPDLWDCAFWVAGAEAGGLPWVDGFNKDRYRDFWLWYLDTAIPSAWESVPE